ITHFDVSDFGNDRVFAWKLLSDWVSTPDDGDEAEMAERYVLRVELSPVEHAIVVAETATSIVVERTGEEDPSVEYTIEVTRASLLDDVEVGESDDVYHFPESATKENRRTTRVIRTTERGAVATFDNLRDAAFSLLSGYGGAWGDYVMPWIVRWSRSSDVNDT